MALSAPDWATSTRRTAWHDTDGNSLGNSLSNTDGNSLGNSLSNTDGNSLGEQPRQLALICDPPRAGLNERS